MQTRDQQTLAVLDVNVDTGVVTERHRIRDNSWVELVPGTPRLHGGRLVTVEDYPRARRLCFDGEPVTGAEMQVRRVSAVNDERVLIVASFDPTTTDMVSVDWDGHASRLTGGDGCHDSVSGGHVEVRTRRTLAGDDDHDGPRSLGRRLRTGRQRGCRPLPAIVAGAAGGQQAPHCVAAVGCDPYDPVRSCGREPL